MNLHALDISIVIGYLVLCLIIGLFKLGKVQNKRKLTCIFNNSKAKKQTSSEVKTAQHKTKNKICKVLDMGINIVSKHLDQCCSTVMASPNLGKNCQKVLYFTTPYI
jgi:hypothetical protein